MKQITTITLILFLSVGCVIKTNQPSPIKVVKDNTDHLIDYDDVLVIEYDSCEYVRFDGGERCWGGHKGNCKFCEQRRLNKGVEEIYNSEI